MKALIFIILFFQLLQPALAANGSIKAPALQLKLKEYKDYFKDPADYRLNLKTRSKYKISCDSEIIGVVYADRDNIKMYDVIDEDTEENDLKSVFIKTKSETYTYIRLYKYTGEITNIILSVNAAFKEDETIPLGSCTVFPT